jgi:hypothetical protein
MKMSGQLHAPAALTLGKDTPVPLEWKLSVTQSWPGFLPEETNLLPLPGIEIMIPQTSSV